MPPLLASCLCVGFILCLFYRNAKEHADVSNALWIPTLWVAIIASMPVAAWLNGREDEVSLSAAGDGSTSDRNVFLALLVAGVFILARRRFSWGRFFSENRWLFLLYAFAFVSLVWSDYPFVAFKRWIRVVGSLVMVLIILTEANPSQAVRQVLLRCAFCLIPLSILTIKYYLAVGVYYDQWTGEAAYCGVTTDKNGLGRIAWVSGLILVWSIDRSAYSSWIKMIMGKWSEVILLLMCFWVLKKAHSATSIFCFIAATGVYFSSRLRWIRSNPKIIAFGASFLILLSLLCLSVTDLRKAVTGSLGRNENLTERTVVWEHTLAQNTNPVIGVGFASFWLTRGGRDIGESLKVGEAHNGYLETYLNTGALGVLLLFTVLISAGKNTLRHLVAGSPLGCLYAALFIGGIFYNYTETNINDSSFVGFLVFMLAASVPSLVPIEGLFCSQEQWLSEA